MTIVLRPRASVFHAEGGWFSANWHFSFDQYLDEANMGLGDLRVFNDDRLVPGAAWPMHPHRDVEGITYVAEGTFEHADSRGNGGILHPGAVQRATLGSGMQHSERNGSKTEPMRFIQMWIMPSRRGLEPSIEQREFPADARRNALKPVLVPAPGFRSGTLPFAFRDTRPRHGRRRQEGRPQKCVNTKAAATERATPLSDRASFSKES